MNRLDLQLPHSLTAPRIARHTITAWLTGLHCPEQRRQDAIVVLSELVTNAFRHTDSAPVVTVWCNDGRIRIEVVDTSLTDPIVREADSTTPGGLGLHVVSRLSEVWGWAPQAGGKVVWAELLY